MRYGVVLAITPTAAVLQMEMGQMCFKNVPKNGLDHIKQQKMNMDNIKIQKDMAVVSRAPHQVLKIKFVKVSMTKLLS